MMQIFVLAIDREGNNRFTYRGNSEHQEECPCIHHFGICTDVHNVFSHPNKLYHHSSQVQYICLTRVKFLSFLMINALESARPYTLSYNVNAHLLFVGTGDNNIIYAYRYIDRQDIVTSKLV